MSEGTDSTPDTPPAVTVEGSGKKKKKQNNKKQQAEQQEQKDDQEESGSAKGKEEQTNNEGDKDEKRDALRAKLQERRRSRAGEEDTMTPEAQRKAEAAAAVRQKLEAKKEEKMRRLSGEGIELQSKDTALVGQDLLFPSQEREEALKTKHSPRQQAASSNDVADWKRTAVLIGRWEPDESRISCTKCSVEFGFFTRRHHCRRFDDFFVHPI